MEKHFAKEVLESEDTLKIALAVSQGLDLNGYIDDMPMIVWAAIRDLWVTVEMMITLGTDINVIDSKGDSVLHYAVYEENESMVDLLITNNIDMTIVDCKPRYVVNECLLSPNADICKKLIDYGMYVNVTPSPLETTVANSMYNLTEIFLQAGCNPYVYSKTENFPLKLALVNADLTMTKLLLEYGISPMHSDVLEFVMENEMEDFLDLIALYPLNRDKDGTPAFIAAVQAGFDDMIEVFLNHSLHLDTTIDGEPLLFHIARYASVELIKSVSKYKVQSLWLNGESACHLYIRTHERESGVEAVGAFLQMGISPDDTDGGGNTLLHLACMYCEEDHPLVEYLFSVTTNLNANISGKTATMLLNDE